LRVPPTRYHHPRRRIGRGIVATGALAGLAVVAIGVVLTRSHRSATPTECQFGAATGITGYAITPVQAQNAAIIAAVALRKGMPDHAASIALATSLQETQLRNLPYGDLDSVGLFQQRPSQGWGTNAQIMDPNYAASAFYDHLAQISGWQTMAVTEAAQLVQHSAAPDAYAAWENEARALASAMTGEVPAGLACHLDSYGGVAPAPTALAEAATSELGTQLLGVPVSTKVGWQVACWAVAHAYTYHLKSVSFGGSRWTVGSGRWAPAAGAAPGNMITVT